MFLNSWHTRFLLDSGCVFLVNLPEIFTGEGVNHYFYRITNKINGKYYLGVRSYSGDPEKDYYMGSGPAIRAAVRKYGKQNFTNKKKRVAENKPIY